MSDAVPSADGAVATRSWDGKRLGGRFGNGFFAVLVRCGGLRLAPFFVFWVALWFLLTRKPQRAASMVLARRLGLARSRLAALRFAFGHFFTYGLMLLERMAMLLGKSGQLRIDYHGESIVREACRSGRGAVLLTAHFGNWAAMGQVVAQLGVPLTVLMYDGMDPGLREQMARSEGAALFSTLYTDGSPGTAAAALALLRSGQAVGMMGDRVFAGRPVRVPFLGSEVALPIGPYVLAASAGALLVHAFLVRTGPRRYTLRAEAIDAVQFGARRDRERDLQRFAGAFADALAALVRQYPKQWGNFHDVWATAVPR